MKEFWNSRYSTEAFAYGEAPNVFFAEALNQLKAGKILLPADGEGRNAVFAAKNKWEVSACDMSEAGQKKALQLAKKEGVSIDYQVEDFGQINYQKEDFDAVALIYAHFPVEIRSAYHRLADQYLKVGGTLIIEAFGKNHLAYSSKSPKVGGPKKLEMLFSVEELELDFPNYDIRLLEELEVDLAEGEFHVGKASVVRFVGVKMTDV